jgi:hypothetical protein
MRVSMLGHPVNQKYVNNIITAFNWLFFVFNLRKIWIKCIYNSIYQYIVRKIKIKSNI